MTLSIIISVLDSHEIFRRQLAHWKALGLPSSVEFIILDDGSSPPLLDSVGVPNLSIHPTHNRHIPGDTNGWTVEMARNMGARLSQADYLLMTDIDYIIPRSAIDAALLLTEDKMSFKREFGVLDVHGNFTQDLAELRRWGLLESRISERGVNLPPHPNNFVMRRSTFWQLGGYREDLAARTYPNKGDTYFKRTWAAAYEAGRVTIQDPNLRPTLYMFPNGQYCGDVDYNPFGLFHSLSRKTTDNHWYTHPRSPNGNG